MTIVSSKIRAFLAASALAGVAILAACSSDPAVVTAVPDASPNCGDGSQLCGATCTILAHDNENCGTCGKKCVIGEVCSQGACATSCGGGTTKCGTACVDQKSDGANCGGCGTACKTGEVCSAGKCALSCGGGTKQCGASCVNQQNDPTNCGGCGTLCQAGEGCVSGKCQLGCQVGLTLCTAPVSDGGVPDASSDASNDASSDASSDGSSGDSGTVAFPYCVNVQTDDQNCGGCGVACGSGQQCVNGACACGASETLCGNVCANTQNDPANCGMCGTVCPQGTACSSGFCKKIVLPNACDGGKDPQTGSPYVVCTASPSEAWLSANTGGTYHATEICQLLGYSKLGSFGGTCGTVCGYCDGNHSCNNLGTKKFDGSGNAGTDAYGQKLSNTVTWQCLP